MGGVITENVTVTAIDVPNRLLHRGRTQRQSADNQTRPERAARENQAQRKGDYQLFGRGRNLSAETRRTAHQQGQLDQPRRGSRHEHECAGQNWVEATPSGDTDFSTVEVTDTVAAINYNKRIITFAAANGQTRKILIDPSVPGLDQIQVGDQVVLLVTRSIAVNVKTI